MDAPIAPCQRKRHENKALVTRLHSTYPDWKECFEPAARVAIGLAISDRAQPFETLRAAAGSSSRRCEERPSWASVSLVVFRNEEHQTPRKIGVLVPGSRDEARLLAAVRDARAGANRSSPRAPPERPPRLRVRSRPRRRRAAALPSAGGRAQSASWGGGGAKSELSRRP